MDFRTKLSIAPSTFQINHHHKILLVGSCFSQNIGDRLQKYKFNCISNPYGTIFNPISIVKLLLRTCKNDNIFESELISSQDLIVHPDFHSKLASTTAGETLGNIQKAISTTHYFLKEADYLFITLGTAIAYRFISTDQVVANCHKLPQNLYSKYPISIDEGAESLDFLIKNIHILNPNINIIFTISPVRHIKDGIIENSRSKARLVSMVEQIQQKHTLVSYFPSYEWMMDDLRDYRFYGADMIHPNDVALDYLWGQFSDHYFDEKTKELNTEILKIHLKKNHSPMNSNTESFEIFQKNYHKRLQILIENILM